MPLRIIDETAAQNVIEVADGGQRIGVNGAADSSAIVTVAGVTFVAGNARFAVNTVATTSVNPTQGTVTVSSGSTATITTPVAVVAAVDQSGYISDDPGTNFKILNGSGGSVTYKYSYW